ncbi:MAG: aconitase X swivel domain-containing protein [Hyphomicrobiaceae bacterium]
MVNQPVALMEGRATGRALVLSEPLSFWGGIDCETGDIVDATHAERGKNVAGRILVMPMGRGSSSSSSTFAETLRRGTGPVGIVLERNDPILLVGALVVKILYGMNCPIVVCPNHGILDSEMISLRASSIDGQIVKID